MKTMVDKRGKEMNYLNLLIDIKAKLQKSRLAEFLVWHKFKN